MSVEMISEALRENIEAELVKYTLVPRSTYDGEEFDILSDFVVLWKRGASGEESWGTHRGTIRGPRVALKACLFTGHYDMGKKAARLSFDDRQVSLG